MDTCDRIEGTLIDSLQFIGEFHKWKECRCILCQEIQRHNYNILKREESSMDLKE